MERTCVTLEVWQQIEEAVNQVVDHITLADLVKRYHEKAGADYVI
jgi:DNA-binding IscR family transcriptional regulator